MPETGIVADINTIRRTRSAAQGWVTRSIGNLKDILRGGEDKFSVHEGLNDLDKRLTALEEVQTLYESAVKAEELTEAIDEIAPTFRGASKLKAEAMRYLATLDGAANMDRDSVTSAGSSSANVKLPKLELPHFEGDATEWPQWWASFQATIGDSDIPDVTKFSYLQTLLKGQAAGVIKGLPLSAKNYTVACELLKERYGRMELIIFSHIQALMKVEGEGRSSLSKLRNLLDNIQVHVRSLESLDITGNTYGMFLTPLILSRLPVDVRMQWAREGKGREGDLDFLLTFMKKELETRERAETFKATESTSSATSEKRTRHNVPTASALLSPEACEGSCGYCHKKHATMNCLKLWSMSIQDRQDAIYHAGLCFRCLSSSHLRKQCTATNKCRNCGGRHYKMMCNKNNGNTSNDNVNSFDTNHVGVAQGRDKGAKSVFMQLAKGEVTGPYGKQMATILFDSGSDHSYVTEGLARRLGFKRVATVNHKYAVFGGESSAVSSRNVSQFDLTCINKSSLTIKGIEVPKICAPISRPKVPIEVLRNLKGLPLAWGNGEDDVIQVDILIGLDMYWQVVQDDVIRIPGYQHLAAQKTLVGYILSGHFLSEKGLAPRSLTSHQLFCLNDISDNELRQFWDLESIGILDTERKSTDDPVLTAFNKSIKLGNERYCVGLPWKEGMKDQLWSNEASARIRLNRLNMKLGKDLSLQDGYNAALREMEAANVIEEVSKDSKSLGPVYYMPHRPVVRESSTTTKIRPVFDASAKAGNGLSMNDCLETGPSLNPNLVEVLIRFRRWLVALTSDISKAFLQIALKKEDKDVHRFLWKSNDRTRIMRFNRVTFGVKSSPFLLNATIKYHLGKCEPSNVVKELSDNLYVDDWLTGADHTQEVSNMYEEAEKIMAKAGMKLAKWNSNSRAIREFVADSNENSIKVLGVLWSLQTDCFSFAGLELPSDLVVTKRAVLSVIARIFDPLGFMLPFTITAKVIFQKLWQLGLNWDEEVGEDLSSQFKGWIDGFNIIKSWNISRRYSNIAWSSVQGIELHAFGDASMSAYGAAVYIRIPMGNSSYACSLVTSKAKVAPLKKITLPRLELLSSLLAARLLVFVKDALRLPDITSYRCWSDSTAALGWIKGDPNRWKQFVANRAIEIQNLTEPHKWSYCPTEDNPADLLTRGISATSLVNSGMWLKGPDWLSACEEQWPQKSDCQCMTTLVIESESLLSATNTKPEKVFEVERWSKFTKAVRVVAWVLRFINNAKNPKAKVMTKELSFEEQLEAKMCLFKEYQVQAFFEEMVLLKKGLGIPKGSVIFRLSPYLDERGFLRVKGRLQKSDLSYDEKHPLILPKGHCAKLLVRFQHILLKHAGVSTLIATLRNSLWICGLRQICKTVVYECVPCQRLMAKPCNQPAAPLPEDRVTKSPPFSVTGIDYAGPVFCSDFPKGKFYIVLFTCGVVRAIHLELASSLTSHEFVLAFRRFASRRAVPKVVYSDNAKTFPGSQKELQNTYGHLAPKWKFIVPRSPWWGGWWERLVRSVKGAIKKTVGKGSITKVELETLLSEIEFIINSRPLTFIGDDVTINRPLTPNHFLLGGVPSYGQLLEDPESMSLLEAYQGRQDRLNVFWRIWAKDYLRNLPCVVPQFVDRGFLKVGSIVVIREDNIPRLRWLLGRVVEVYPGKDGKIRSVKLHTPKADLVRSIQRLHKLEFLDPPSNVSESEKAQTPTENPNVPNNPKTVKQPSNPKSPETRVVPESQYKEKVSKYGRKIIPVDRMGYK
jgi:hypothetical protein